MSLTDNACKTAKPKDKPFKLSDSRGLYLEVMPNGSKYWRLKYRFHNKEKRLALGVYPFVTLAEARDGREKAKKLLARNIDPSDNKRDERREALKDADNTFKAVANEWLTNKKEEWTDNYYSTVQTRLDRDIFPYMAKDLIHKIDAPALLEVLKKIEARGALHLAKKARQHCGQIFRYGIQTGKCSYNPALDLKDALRTRKTKHHAAIEPEEIPQLVDAIERNEVRLYARTRRAIKLSLLTFLRPSEICEGLRAEIDLEKKQWLIPAERMKMGRDHLIPLSDQAVAILKEQQNETGHMNSQYIFPSQINCSEPMSNGTVRVALHKLGYKDRMTAHGFRALARTAIREELDYEPDVIETQLAHKPTDPLGEAYDRTKFIKQRKAMMQDWADYIDKVTVEYRNKVVQAKFGK
jgi:integrase